MSQSSDNNKRIISSYFNDISILRVSAMLMVVLYHCLCPYSIWDGTDFYMGFHVSAWDVFSGMLAQIHLPLFFMISGYLFGYKRIRGGDGNTARFMKDKALRVLVPYVVVGVFLCVLQHRDFEQMLYGISHLWFLLSIFEFYIVGKVIERVLWMQTRSKYLLICVSILFLVLLSYRLHSTPVLSLSNITKYFPFYLFSMLMCQTDFKAFGKYKNGILLLVILSLLCLLLQQIYFKRAIVTHALGTSIVFGIFVYARTLDVKRLPNWMVSLDKCSMGIYIIHHIVIQEMNGIHLFHSLACDNYYVYPLLQFVAVTVVSWQFVSLCRKIKYSKYVLG